MNTSAPSAPSTLTIAIDGMSCAHCVAQVRAALGAVPGIQLRSVELGSATLDARDTAAASAALTAIHDAGYEARVALPLAPIPTPRAGGCCGGGQGKCGCS